MVEGISGTLVLFLLYACGWSMLMRAGGDLRMPLQEGFGRSGLCPPGTWRGGVDSFFFVKSRRVFQFARWGGVLSWVGTLGEKRGGERMGVGKEVDIARRCPPWRFVKRKFGQMLI